MRKPREKTLLALPILALAAVLPALAFQAGRSAPQFDPMKTDPMKTGPMKTGPMKIHVDPDLQGKLQALETRLEALRRERHVPGLSVAVVQGQEVVYLKGLGTGADGRTATPDTAYSVPSLNRRAGQTWTVRDLAQLDVLLSRGAKPESRPYLAWHVEEAGGTQLQWSAAREPAASLLYLKLPERGLALILLAGGEVEKPAFTAAFLKTFAG